MAVLPDAVGPVRIQQSGPSTGLDAAAINAASGGAGTDGRVSGVAAGGGRCGRSDRDEAEDMSRPGEVLEQLEQVIASRRHASADRSYTRKLLVGGATAAGAKVVEEAGEFVAAAEAETAERVVSEAADLFYHALVLLAVRDVPFERVGDELARRFGVSGLEEKASRPPRTGTADRNETPGEEKPSA